MRKSNFSEEQIAFALKQTGTGSSISKVCSMLGVSERTFYRWKSKYNGLVADEISQLKKLEAENERLKKMVLELSMDKASLQDLLAKRWSEMSVRS